MTRTFLRWFSRSTDLDFSTLEPVQPRVTPDPEAVDALERRRAALDYQPSNGFLVEPATGESA